MVGFGDRYYMPCWKWEHLDENVARMYASQHSRLAIPGQLCLWNSDRSKLTNLINKTSTKLSITSQ